MKAVIRKLLVTIDETLLEMGRSVVPPSRHAVGAAVIANPLAGRYADDLGELVAIGEELGGYLAEQCVAALRVDGSQIHSFGKAAIVGEAGELEHAAAILHPKMGAPLRQVLGTGAALVPSSKKLGQPGATIDIPLGHKDAAYVRSHFDAVQVSIGDAPRPNEILVAIALTDSGRPLPRIGGLTADGISEHDGLR